MYSVQLSTFRHQCVCFMQKCLIEIGVCVEKESVCWDESEQAREGRGGWSECIWRFEGVRSLTLVWRFSGRSGCLGL